MFTKLFVCGILFSINVCYGAENCITQTTVLLEDTVEKTTATKQTIPGVLIPSACQRLIITVHKSSNGVLLF